MGNKTRNTGNLVSENNIFVDIANDRVGIGSTQPTSTLNVAGIVSATSFVGDGTGITGLNASQVGALADIVTDTDPQLGGDLDVNGNDIIGTGNVNLTGVVTATAFSGDGNNLTGLTASQVGALAGVSIREEGIVVGTTGSVGDINFVSDNLTATASGAGATITLTETPSFTNIVVGSAVTINSSGINASGVITATSFDGSLATTDLTGTITNAQLAGSIENSKLSNSTVSYGGVQLSLGGSDATPAFDLSDATNYPYTSLTGITTEIVGDTTPQLGGDLDVNGNDIIGTGNVNLTGVITATAFVGDGTGITGLTASQVGALAGVTIQEEGSTVGTVGSVENINFVSDNLTATASGAGATITLTETPEFDNLTVTGVSTLAGITSVTGSTLFAKQLNVSGVSTFSDIDVRSFNAKFGTSAGSQITLNGNGGELIKQNGSLKLYGGGTSGSEVGILNNSNIYLKPNTGGVDLYYGKTDKKFETTNDGAIVTGILTATSFVGDGSNLTNVATEISNDTTPQLGGDLDVNSNDITGTGNVNLTGNITATGDLDINNTVFAGNSTFSESAIEADMRNNFSSNAAAVVAKNRLSGGRVWSGRALAGETSYILENGSAAFTGIITAVSGIVTYYGDGSNLTNVGGASSINDLSDALTNSNGETIGLGLNALANDDGGANKNTAVGYNALSTLTSGSNNVAVGWEAGKLATGTQNTLIGSRSGGKLTTGGGNSFVGWESGYECTEGFYNVGVGRQALDAITTGSYNAAIGYQAMANSGTGVTSNVAIGYQALFTVTGDNNTALGKNAGDNLTSGTNNIIIGQFADASSATVSNEITLGNTDITTFRIPGIGITFTNETSFFNNLNVSGISTFTGNIVVSGTVDGRDVATDGTKLDGIETGATADQTAAEILTAIKTVDGSTSGLDADTLDGIEGSSFLRSDANDGFSGALTGSTGSRISFGNVDTTYDTSGEIPTSGTHLINGADNGTSTATPANINLYSWYGVGFGPSITGQTVTKGELSHLFNARNGDATFVGSLTCVNVNSTSDINLKKDIEVITDGTNLIKQLNGVKFTWKKNDEKSVGVIAQEVEKVLPELVSEKEDTGEKSVNYSGLIGVLIEAVKEQQNQINDLKQEIIKLKKES